MTNKYPQKKKCPACGRVLVGPEQRCYNSSCVNNCRKVENEILKPHKGKWKR